MLRVYAVLTLIAVRLRWRWVTAKGSSLPTFSKTSPRKLPGLFESWSLCGVSIVLSECTRRASAFPQLACGHINTYIIVNQQIPERDFKLRILGIGDFDKERLSPGRVLRGGAPGLERGDFVLPASVRPVPQSACGRGWRRREQDIRESPCSICVVKQHVNEEWRHSTRPTRPGRSRCGQRRRVLLREQARLDKYVWSAPLIHQPHTLSRDRNNLELVHRAAEVETSPRLNLNPRSVSAVTVTFFVFLK